MPDLRALLMLVLPILAAAGCESAGELKVDTSRAADIPRDIAVDRLRELLPTCGNLRCTLPEKEIRAGQVAEWNVDAGAVWVRAKDDPKPLLLSFHVIKEVSLHTFEGSYRVKVFTRTQHRKGMEHFAFVWDAMEPARRAVELFEVLRIKE